jgi:hypothetical protein
MTTSQPTGSFHVFDDFRRHSPENVTSCDPLETLSNYPGGFGSLAKYPALVLHYSGAAGDAFSPHTNRGKLLQHELIRV